MAVEVANRRDVTPTTGGGNPVSRTFRSLVQFYHEVQDEMRKVTWPDRNQLKDTTIKIIIFVLFIGAILGIVDVILQLILVEGLPSLFKGR